MSVDDEIIVEVTRPDGSTASFSHDFSANCGGVGIIPAGPFDITSLFATGTNLVKVRFRDKCGLAGSGASNIRLAFGD